MLIKEDGEIKNMRQQLELKTTLKATRTHKACYIVAVMLQFRNCVAIM